MNQSFTLKTAAVAVRNWIDPNIIQFKPTSPSLRNPIRPRWRRNTLLVIVFALSNFALLAEVKAVDISDTYYGAGAFNATSTGIQDSAFGYNALHSDTSGLYNTATGAFALQSNTVGDLNTATGFWALERNTNGIDNTATGANALLNNNASNNTADGFQALQENTTGTQNTAMGAFALLGNQTASDNTATGFYALLNNATGANNTATGAFALANNNGTNNTADGFQALLNNSTGKENTAVGESAFKNSSVDSNTGIGYQVAFHDTSGTSNTAVGHHALFNNSTGSNNIALGASAGLDLTIGSNNIEIGSVGGSAESNTIRIGGPQTRTFIKGISGVAVSGASVVVNSAGQLGVAASSERFKDEIKPMGKASEVLLALKPVTFRYNKEIDPEGTPQFGLVAEDVEKVNRGLVVPDKEGKPYTVRYDAVNAMLLNEFLREHRKVEEQDCKLQEQGATIARQQKQIDALTAGLQKVSAQLEVSKSTPQTVLNNP